MESINKILDEKREEIVSKINAALKGIDSKLEVDQIRFTKEKKNKCRWVRRKYTYNGKTYIRLIRVCE